MARIPKLNADTVAQLKWWGRAFLKPTTDITAEIDRLLPTDRYTEAAQAAGRKVLEQMAAEHNLIARCMGTTWKG